MKYDDLLKILGEFGRYQRFQYMLVCIISITSSWHSMNMVFVGPTPDHGCRILNQPPQWGNLSEDELSLVAYPPRDDDDAEDGELSQCQMYNVTEVDWDVGDYEDWLKLNRTALDCPDGWLYSTEYYDSTIVDEWDLVCDDAWLRSMASTIFFAGRLVGALVSGQLSDKFGRRPVFFVSVFFQVAIGIGASFADQLWLFYTLYFLQGVAQVAVYLSSFVLGAELVGPTYRKVAGFSNKYFYALGQLLLAGIAYGIRDWRYIELAISIPPLLFFSYYWLMPESVRWLLSQGRQEEAEKIIMKAAKMNKVELSKDVMDQLEIEKRPDKTYTVVDVLKRWTFAKVALNVWFNWMANALVYYGLSINSSNLSGDPYLNFFITAAVEFPSITLALLLIDRMGRRWLFFSFMMLAGIACIATAFVPEEEAWLATTLSMVGKFGVTASYAIIYLMAAEVFPTVVRNVGMGTASMCARIGGMLAPQIVFLDTIAKPLPLLIFGLVSLVGGGLGLLLPESTGKPLPQNFDDVLPQSNLTDNKVDVMVEAGETQGESGSRTSSDSGIDEKENGKNMENDVPLEDMSNKLADQSV